MNPGTVVGVISNLDNLWENKSILSLVLSSILFSITFKFFVFSIWFLTIDSSFWSMGFNKGVANSVIPWFNKILKYWFSPVSVIILSFKLIFF